MAKVKQIKMKLGLNTKRPWLETVVAINYDSTDRQTSTYRRPVPPDSERFFIKLPQVVADALGMEKAKAGDQDEVVVRFKELIEQYKRLDTVVNQVILYTIEVSPKPGGKVTAFSDGTRRVIVWAGTYEETVAIAGDGGERYSYARVESPVHFTGDADGKHYFDPVLRRSSRDAARFDTQVPWNEQNEAFFVWIKDNLTLLIERLHELENPDNLIETISAGRLLPLGNPASEL